MLDAAILLQDRNWFKEERNVNITCCGEHIFVWVASPSLTQLYNKQNLSRTSTKKEILAGGREAGKEEGCCFFFFSSETECSMKCDD